MCYRVKLLLYRRFAESALRRSPPSRRHVMTKYIRRLRTSLVLSAAIAVAACTVKDNKSDSSLARDTALNRDLALAGQDTTIQPQLRDVPATPAATPAPAPTPAPRASTPAKRPS